MKKTKLANKKLEAFLRKKGILDAFINNSKLSGGAAPLSMDENLHISEAFSWEDTPEGHELWSRLSLEFEKEILKKGKTKRTKPIIYISIVWMLLYLFAAFITQDLNPGTWTQESRIILVISLVVSAAVTAGAIEARDNI